ncbi:MAG: hypothetical protein WC022_03620 [Parcubacteria group bacterium]
MKENYALITEPDTQNKDIIEKTGGYAVVIRPGRSLRERATVFSQKSEIIQTLSDAGIPVPSNEVDLPTEICPFTFNTYYKVTEFLAEHRLIIGYDHIDSIGE